MNRIEDYFLIGDLHSAALVSKDASIDWLCLPHFDSPSIFARLLDEKAGHFAVETKDYKVESNYIKDTAVVEFRFANKDSRFVLHDFMVPQAKDTCETHFLVRKFKGIRGQSHITLSFSPKANYARDEFEEDEALKNIIPRFPKGFNLETGVVLKTGKETLLLYLPKTAAIEEKHGLYQIHLVLEEKETQSIVMEYATHIKNTRLGNRNLEKETEAFWKDWVKKGTFFDFCRDQLVRSAITLKLMQYYPTGALVAAPTTSLPEEIGGSRNWDYRYVWIRDATFTLYAFYVLGYKEEAEKFFKFIQTITEKCAKKGFDVSLFYTIEGKPVPNEQTLDYLSGYKNSKPVRIGNGAKDQFQLDVYGALIDAHYFALKHHQDEEMHTELIVQLVKKIKELWQKKDRGIWEVRTGDEHFTYSKVMAWVGADRASRLFEMLKHFDQAEECKKLAQEIQQWIWDTCYDKKRKVFKQHPKTQNQDATSFLFVLLQFLNKHDPLTKTIIENTCKELCFEDVFVYRYFTEDGLPRGEGAFLLCTFWYISALAILEDTEGAEQLFSQFQMYMKPHALLSEEIDIKTKEYLGNYPQAFSHLGFIMSAYYIDRYKKKKKSQK